MDRYELRVKAEAVDALIFDHKYKKATQLADQLDWSHVQSVRILCRVSDLYKYDRRYEDSRDVLEFAYRRCPRNSQILYSMCELELKLGNYIRALQLYNAYINVAPTDSGRYILKYKLYREQDVSLPEQIAVLEELARHDFLEKWSYELARLYHKAGQDRDCADMCDEIIAFFGEGRYVEKALALRKSVTQDQGTRAEESVTATKPVEPAAIPHGEESQNSQQTSRWTQDSVRITADSGSATGIWNIGDVRRAQEANRREYNAARDDRKPQPGETARSEGNSQPQPGDYEVHIDDSPLSDEQLMEPMKKGMQDLYESGNIPQTDTTGMNMSTTRSWNADEIREEEERQQRSGSWFTPTGDTNGVDPEQQYSDDELLQYAQRYAGTQGFQIEPSGMEALSERIDEMHRQGFEVVPEDIREMIGEAVYYSGSSLHAGNADASSNSTKHGNRGDMVLRDKDFIHY